MEITVNREAIDYTLEGERSLGDVVEAVEKWLNDARLIITSLRMGDRELAAEPDGGWVGIPVSEVARLDIIAQALDEVEAEQLALIASCYDRLEAALSASAPLAPVLRGAVAESSAAVRMSLAPAAGSPVALALEELRPLLAGSDPLPDGIRTRALAALPVLREAVNRRSQEIVDPRLALRRAAADLARDSTALAEVSLLLQTARDETAMAHVTRFAESLQSVVRSLSALGGDAEALWGGQNGQGFGHFVEGLNGVLRQVIEAFTARDTVLLGDLLEYEVAPRVARLGVFLRTLESSA